MHVSRSQRIEQRRLTLLKFSSRHSSTRLLRWWGSSSIRGDCLAMWSRCPLAWDHWGAWPVNHVRVSEIQSRHRYPITWMTVTPHRTRATHLFNSRIRAFMFLTTRMPAAPLTPLATKPLCSFFSEVQTFANAAVAILWHRTAVKDWNNNNYRQQLTTGSCSMLKSWRRTYYLKFNLIFNLIFI